MSGLSRIRCKGGGVYNKHAIFTVDKQVIKNLIFDRISIIQTSRFPQIHIRIGLASLEI